MNFESALIKFKARAGYWLAQRKPGCFFQVRGFEIFALSVLNFIVQLYPLPNIFEQEVHDWSLRFSLGPGHWI